MAIHKLLIMNLLRIITPEEIADIATKHNGGKFLSLTDLVNERIDRKIYRDFSSTDSMDEIHEEHNEQKNEKINSAKILPFNLEKNKIFNESATESPATFNTQAKPISQISPVFEEEQSIEEVVERVLHKENENMSSFILIEKARLKQSQKSLKQKEIISLYQRNSNIDVEQIKSSNQDPSTSSEAGVLVNKKHY